MTAPNRSMVLGIILACYLMIIVDISVIITALPDIHRALGFSSTALSWVQSAYALTFGGLLLLGARAGDILGRRRVFMAGIALFTPASPSRQHGCWRRGQRRASGLRSLRRRPSPCSPSRFARDRSARAQWPGTAPSPAAGPASASSSEAPSPNGSPGAGACS